MAEQNGTNTGKCAEEYVVKRGDSFYLIAHKLGVPLRDLLAANRDIHPARLMVGDVLCVPREEDDSPSTGGLGGGSVSDAAATGTALPTLPSRTLPSGKAMEGACPSFTIRDSEELCRLPEESLACQRTAYTPI